jgi:tRNA (mo5U34)-methyltransferase
MLGAGAKLALGIDPTRLFCYQFQALQRLQPQNDAAMLPLLDQDLPITHSFDTVFSMGVLYHRKQPEVHLDICRQALVPGGELILETLIIDHPGEAYLKPEGRYAKMRNVGELPSVARLFKQLSASGFLNAQVVDLSPTSTLEQRATDWMHFQSLSDFLDPKAPELTIEGHPAPLRAVVSAKAP